MLGGAVPVGLSAGRVAVTPIGIRSLVGGSVGHMVDPTAQLCLHRMRQGAVAPRIGRYPVAAWRICCGSIGGLGNSLEWRPMGLTRNRRIVVPRLAIPEPAGHEEPEATNQCALE